MPREFASKERNFAELRAARKAKRSVRVRRVFGQGSDIDAMVMRISERWIVLARLVEDGLGGFAVIRADTILCVEPDPSERFHRRAVELTGRLPSKKVAKGLDLGRTRDLITSVAAASPLVTLHTELDWPDECYIGVPLGFVKRHVELREITPEATWDRDPRWYRLRDVTRVDFDGSYERTLHAVAGRPPKH